MKLKNIINDLDAEKVIYSFVVYGDENKKSKWEQLEFTRGSLEEQNFISSQTWEVLKIKPIDGQTLKIYLY